MAIANLGPTFPDLAANVNRNVSQISFIFIGRSSGYFGGTLIGGLLVDCMNAKILLGFSMLATAMGLYAIPWCKTATLLTAMMSVIGFSMGVLDTGGNVTALDTWGVEADPHIQALHFSFALGAFMAPILDKMVLGGSAVDLQDHLGSTSDHQPTVDSPVSSEKLHFTVMLSYTVIGTYILLVALFFCLLYWRSGSTRDRRKSSAQQYKIAKYHYALLILLSIFFFWYVGAEVAYGAYIFTYAKTYVGMKESEAAGLNSVFWGSFAACRGLAICLAICSRPVSIIVLSIIFSTVSSLTLTLFNTHPVSLWLGSAVYGASLAALFPSGISWLEQYTTIQGKSATLFVMGAAMGQMCIPAAVGFLQGHYPAVPVLMYTALVSAIMTDVLFPVLYKLATSPSDPNRKGAGDRNLSEALLFNSHLEEEDEEVKEWNEVDFEVIEMNDMWQNSVIETSTNIQGASALELSSRSRDVVPTL
ncbi:sodium-dependent glucose transporter 1 [Anolis sagrei]|uniref:sodium-dependent glucose transporter 1 n=1 Tax=Anolis sagrei TaxID=38937 RepID=UPI00352281BD